jgi:hypothetical protein
MRTWFRFIVLVTVGMAVPLVVETSRASVQSLPENFTAFAVNLNPGGPSTASVDIRIERWSTPEERTALLNILKEESDPRRANDALLRALQQMPKAGFIRTPQTLAWDLRYTQESPLEEGGRRIVVATDRPIGFWEARNQPRTIDYPFTLLELRLDTENRGEGKMLAGTKIFIDQKTNTLVLEDYAQQPVRLNEIRSR